MSSSSAGLAEFGVSPITGFLPEADPLRRLPSAFDAWESLAIDLPKALMSDYVRHMIEALPPFPIDKISNPAELERAMVVLSYLGHAYVWGGERPATTIPAVLAVPWHAVAKRMGRPPVLSYSSYSMHNFIRFDPTREREVGNVALIQNFMGGADEEWFVLIHVDIEARAAAAIGCLLDAQQAVVECDADAVKAHLHTIKGSLDGMNATMNRMGEWCDPYVYYHRVRPYIHGWRNHPDVPDGVVYEGVDEYAGKPQTFRGETGAQSGIVPALDAFLGVGHAPDELRTYLMEMREYMPPGHRAFVEKIEAGPDLRVFVAAHPALTEIYDACVAGVHAFRAKHLEFAATYIFKQAQTDAKNPHAVGTGGTPFMTYLKKHRDETEEHLIAK